MTQKIQETTTVILLSSMKIISFYDLNWFINTRKPIVKIYKKPMEKITIILWSIWIHTNQVVFRKIKPNQFLIIEKATSTFQNLDKLMSDAYPNNEGRNVPRKIERWIQWIPPISEKKNISP